MLNELPFPTIQLILREYLAAERPRSLDADDSYDSTDRTLNLNNRRKVYVQPVRRCSTSRIGGAPNIREYSRLNCEGLS